MFSLPALSRKTAGLTGTAGMMLLVTLVLPVQAAEKDELATVMRQLDQVRAALDRARTASLQATPHDGRYFFDYPRAQADIQTMQEGIDRYLTPSRAQPRNGSAVTGEYRRESP
ncbi:hypothetical protein BMA70_002957 [Escherichia coli]|nr:hypothetical protein [Escherichia coli]